MSHHEGKGVRSGGGGGVAMGMAYVKQLRQGNLCVTDKDYHSEMILKYAVLELTDYNYIFLDSNSDY